MIHHNLTNLGRKAAGRLLIEVQLTKKNRVRRQFTTFWDALKAAWIKGRLVETDRDAVVAAADYIMRQRLIVRRGYLFPMTMAILRIV